MDTSVVLAATHHDPHGQLEAQARRVLPRLREWYSHIVISVSSDTRNTTRDLLTAAGATVYASDPRTSDAFLTLGRQRREVVALALAGAPQATHAHLCDFDRILHWAEFHSAELQGTLADIRGRDFTVLGRTARAFHSHPRVQRDTEAIIVHAFALTSARDWDVGAASRGLSRRAADAISAGCADDTIGNDCSWPLFLLRRDGLSLGYRETEGLEYETPDRYATEIAAAGGLDAWVARIDQDPQQWALRLELARIEVESAARYRLSASG